MNLRSCIDALNTKIELSDSFYALKMKYAHYNSFNIKYIYVNLSCKYLINSRVTLLTSQ